MCIRDSTHTHTHTVHGWSRALPSFHLCWFCTEMTNTLTHICHNSCVPIARAANNVLCRVQHWFPLCLFTFPGVRLRIFLWLFSVFLALLISIDRFIDSVVHLRIHLYLFIHPFIFLFIDLRICIFVYSFVFLIYARRDITVLVDWVYNTKLLTS